MRKYLKAEVMIFMMCVLLLFSSAYADEITGIDEEGAVEDEMVEKNVPDSETTTGSALSVDLETSEKDDDEEKMVEENAPDSETTTGSALSLDLETSEEDDDEEDIVEENAPDSETTTGSALSLDLETSEEELIEKTGKVYDFDGENGIPDVLITFERADDGRTYESITGTDGYYAVELPSGVYNVTLKSEGFYIGHSVISVGEELNLPRNRR